MPMQHLTGLLAGTDTVSLFGYSFNFDKRDSRYKPTNGFNVVIDQDIAGLGQVTI